MTRRVDLAGMGIPRARNGEIAPTVADVHPSATAVDVEQTAMAPGTGIAQIVALHP
jgi:hypothetical protein